MPTYDDDEGSYCFTETQHVFMEAIEQDMIKFEQGEKMIKFKMISFRSDGQIMVTLEDNVK